MKKQKILIRAGSALLGSELKTRERVCILIAGEHIKALLPWEAWEQADEKTERVDLSQYTVLPGMMDCHSHLAMDAGREGHLMAPSLPYDAQWILAKENLKKDLDSGVTTMRCMGDKQYLDIALQKEISEGTADGPDLKVCGIGMRSARGHGYAGVGHEGAAAFRITALENLHRGADHLKLFLTPGTPAASVEELIPCFLSQEEIRAVTQIGKETGRPVTAHCLGGEAVSLCIREGVTVIDHLYNVTKAQARLLEETFSGWVDLTSGIVLDEAREAFLPREQAAAMRRARPFVKACLTTLCHSRHIRFTIGTDAYHGNLWKELVFAEACGFSKKAALQAVTVQAAQMLGEASRKGRIEEGYLADLIAVAQNPLTDLQTLSHVLFVMKHGTIARIALQ